MTKTNKSYFKRIRITKRGKLLSRKPGQDHFNAKQTGARKIGGKRLGKFQMTNKNKGRYLPNK